MYTGTLIDDLMATVKRAEERTDAQETREQEFAYWHETRTYELNVAGQDLVGVA